MELFARLLAREWFVDAIGLLIFGTLVILVLKFVSRELGSHLAEFMHFLKDEAVEFLHLEPTLGALNFACVALLLLFGVFVIVALEFQKIAGLLANIIGSSKADALAKSADFATLFYCIAIVIVLSLVAVSVEKRQ